MLNPEAVYGLLQSFGNQLDVLEVECQALKATQALPQRQDWPLETELLLYIKTGVMVVQSLAKCFWPA